MKLYIDVSNLIAVDFLTGIQRVVREVIIRILKDSDCEVTLLEYRSNLGEFTILNQKVFLDFYERGEGKKWQIRSENVQKICDLDQDAIFFDIDSVWNSLYKRSRLLPELKERGLKVVTYIYDTIPINHPQFCHTRTLYRFMDYFGANIQYADAIIVSTQSVLESIYEIMDCLKLKRVPGYVSWLGVDFASKRSDNEVDKSVEDIVASGKRYILTVGTIEPRKNHKILLDAFEKALFDKGVCLVFAGRIGWNVEELEKRIRNHKYADEKFFYCEGLNDASIDYLYRHAFMVAFPSFDEGFGLPMIEAFERKTPVIASNCPVLQEVGKENAVYFSPDSVDSFINTLTEYLDDEKKYSTLKANINKFVPFTWDQTTDNILKALRETNAGNQGGQAKKDVTQIVMLSARCEDICNTLPFIEHYMPFIKKLVLCCPDAMEDVFLSSYSGGLSVKILTDNTLLAGRELPQDHQVRNFYLRSLIMQREELDDVFIMSDDDYRPLEHIDETIFVKDGKYQAYYCHSLKTWKGTAGNMTSYDIGMFNTLSFLEEHGYPVFQYSSHMPQIIDKLKYQEFLNGHAGVELRGIDEWSSYFNWLHYKYPEIVHSLPYVTMCWPGSPTDWKLDVMPEKYLFENYYEGLYEEGKIFEQMSTQFCNSIEEENKKKKELCMKRQMDSAKFERVFELYKAVYAQKYREVPSFVFSINEQVHISLPEYIIVPLNGFIRLPAQLLFEKSQVQDSEVKFSYYYNYGMAKLLEVNHIISFPARSTEFEIPLWASTRCQGKLELILIMEYKNKQYKQSVTAFVVETSGYLSAEHTI